MFQSTHPHGVRPAVQPIVEADGVSIHAPTRGATAEGPEKLNRWKVSIHAPTRGATFVTKDSLNLIEVSIHAPTRGATYSRHNLTDQIAFQSTHPHGVRQSSTLRTRTVQSFNPRTHTGCDQIVPDKILPHRSFNPRTHTGCDTKR